MTLVIKFISFLEKHSKTSKSRHPHLLQVSSHLGYMQDRELSSCDLSVWLIFSLLDISKRISGSGKTHGCSLTRSHSQKIAGCRPGSPSQHGLLARVCECSKIECTYPLYLHHSQVIHVDVETMLSLSLQLCGSRTQPVESDYYGHSKPKVCCHCLQRPAATHRNST